VLIASWYMLRMHQGMMHGPVRAVTEKVQDLRFREGLVLAPLAVLIVLLGVFPHPVGTVAAQAVPGYVTLADASQHPVVVPTVAHVSALTEVEP
jgi:NADH-quinone oxidoreductase subunit M